MNKHIMIKIGLGVMALTVIVSAVSVAGYFYVQYQRVRNNPELISQEEVKSVTQVISQFMDLPTDEEPTLATVTDQEKIKDQDFFKKAQNGDKILLYQVARKAILFRPSTKRIIEFAPLAIGSTEQSANTGETVNSIKKVSIYNGSNSSGLTDEIASKLQSLSTIEISDKENAQKKDYSETLVIDVSGSNDSLAKEIVQLIGGKLSTLPDGETRPSSDILIIATK